MTSSKLYLVVASIFLLVAFTDCRIPTFLEVHSPLHFNFNNYRSRFLSYYRLHGRPYHCSPSCSEFARCNYNASISGYSCKCSHGYVGDGLTCERINPCTNKRCGQHEYCRVVGRHLGLCLCEKGFPRIRNRCVRPNLECTEECHSNASCHFTPLGGQVCRCNNDYYGNGKRCFRKDDNYHRRPVNRYQDPLYIFDTAFPV